VPKITRTARTLYEIKGVGMGVQYSYEGKHLEKTVTENRQSLCGSNVRSKTVPESTASSSENNDRQQSPLGICVVVHANDMPKRGKSARLDYSSEFVA